MKTVKLYIELEFSDDVNEEGSDEVVYNVAKALIDAACGYGLAPIEEGFTEKGYIQNDTIGLDIDFGNKLTELTHLKKEVI